MKKRGLVKIVESVIAALIILTVILIAYGEKKSQESLDLAEQARDILNELANENNLRAAVLQSVAGASISSGPIYDFVNARAPDYLNFELRTCNINSACGQPVYKGDVYSAERVISVDITQTAPLGTINPIKIRLFLWEKS